MARYIFQIIGEAIVEADSLAEARRKSKDDENFIEIVLHSVSIPIPEDLLYSMDLEDLDEEEQ